MDATWGNLKKSFIKTFSHSSEDKNVDKILGEKVAVFLDDWTLYRFMKNHMENLREMLQTCRENKLCLNPEKCTFLVPFGNLLGHIVSKQGLLTDPTKVFVILHFSVTVTTKQLKGFLGLTGYYRKFIRGYACISGALEELLKKDVEWEWNEEQ